LIVGRLTASAALWRQGEPPEDRVTIPVPAYLIETGAHRVLVDTGLNPAAIADPIAHYGGPDTLGIFEFAGEESIRDRVELSTITHVVLTHLHFDHAGGLSLLPPGVPVVVQRREWEAGHDPEAIARNFYLAADYAHAADRVVLVEGDHDLLGDGAVRLLPTPGHTPGHQSVLVGERLVIGGDVAHFASGLDDHRFPGFADDFAAQAASAGRLRRMRDAGVEVLPGHDPELLSDGEIVVESVDV
jgi:glyoxylase-like metal-dependent hydrolase (beta-lactamase superfamily II)